MNLAYDLRGNLISSGADSYTYSKLNEMTSGPGVSAMTYDALGRMIGYTAGSTTRFTYAGSKLIDERNTSGTILRRYVHGAGVDDPIVWYDGSGTTLRRWLQTDERGSVVATSDSSGIVVEINKYDEYGIPAPGNAGRFQYTGQVWLPELGLYNYKARMYSPTLGRFMQTDPIGYADGVNWYAYAGGDPVNRTDPSGTEVIVVTAPCSTAVFNANGGSCDEITVYHPHGPYGSNSYNHWAAYADAQDRDRADELATEMWRNDMCNAGDQDACAALPGYIDVGFAIGVAAAPEVDARTQWQREQNAKGTVPLLPNGQCPGGTRNAGLGICVTPEGQAERDTDMCQHLAVMFTVISLPVLLPEGMVAGTIWAGGGARALAATDMAVGGLCL